MKLRRAFGCGLEIMKPCSPRSLEEARGLMNFEPLLSALKTRLANFEPKFKYLWVQAEKTWFLKNGSNFEPLQGALKTGLQGATSIYDVIYADLDLKISENVI